MQRATQTHMEGLIDLREEVRQFSRHLQQSAARSVCDNDRRAYDTALQQLIDNRLGASDQRLKILCYAAAAELGVPVELQADECSQAMAGGRGFALRVLFWAAQRRMASARRASMPGQMRESAYFG